MRISKHTQIRMEERKITNQHLIDCFNNGKLFKHRDGSRWCISDKKVFVVLSEDKQTIVTVFPTGGRKTM